MKIQVLETIKVVEKKYVNITYHNDRFNRTRRKLLGINESSELEKIIPFPEKLDDRVYKCRIVYSDVIHSCEFIPYTAQKITSLTLINADEIDYSYKFLDRALFARLLSRVKTDEILIVKNGYLTDTTYSNIVFFDGVKWVTPSTYLLPGTKRQSLLDNGEIFCGEIKVPDIKLFKYCKLINAMLSWDESPVIPTGEIYPG